MVNSKEKPRAFSIYSLRVKTSTQGACADVFEQHRETNCKTHEHTTTYIKKVQVWQVTCEENAHICKYAKWVCATKSLLRKSSTRKYTFGVLVPWGLGRAFVLQLWSPRLPLQSNPNMWFVHEISQSKMGILTISPFGYFVTKPPLTMIPHKKNKTYGSTMIIYNTKRYLKVNLEVLNHL